MGILASQLRPKTGLILSGGGARAAYQVGVLRAVANLLPRGATNPFQIISGTSAGALNAASLATHAQRLRTGVRTLEHIWRNITSEQIYDPQASNLFTGASGMLLNMLSGKSNGEVRLLDNTPLSYLLSRVIKFERIQRYIDSGLVDALSVTASAYSTGESVSFYQAVQGVEDWAGPHRIGRRVRLGLDHLMASSAIPVFFPAVQIGEQFFGDGAVRQLAPTSPALRLGAQRLFVIGVSGNRTKAPLEDPQTDPPNLGQILGHILNSAFVDTLENDLQFLRHMNRVVPHVADKTLKDERISLKHIELLDVSPSKELNLLATEYYDELPKPLSRYIRPDSSGTLLSLVLFEKGFCSALWELGYRDAMEKETEIRQFFAV